MNYKKINIVFVLICIITFALGTTGCSKQQSATLNNKMKTKNSVSIEPTIEPSIEPTKETPNSDSDLQAEDDPEYQDFMDSITQGITQDTAQIEDDQTSETKDYGTPDASGRVGYPCDIETDKKNFDGTIDIVVGDNLYTTQINDWYANFDQYEGKTVEIEGYYIDEFSPYLFVGRYGPVCPYCQGGYVSFEFYTDEDVSTLLSGKDWIKVTGILRKGKDDHGNFCYIEAISIVKMDKIGVETVAN